MKLLVKKDMAATLGFKAFVPFGITAEAWETWRDEVKLDLGKLSKDKLAALEALLIRHSKVRGVAPLLADVTAWRTVLTDGAATMKARTIKQFEVLLRQYLLHVPGHRLYQRHDDGAMLCYYVSETRFQPPEYHGDDYTPAYVRMTLLYEQIGGQASDTETFHAEHVRGVPVAQVLADAGYITETDALREEYLANLTNYLRISGQVGKQFWARGRAFSMERFTRGEALDPEGQGAVRVVVDVFSEGGSTRDRDSGVKLNALFWPTVAKGGKGDDEDEDEDAGGRDKEGDLAAVPDEIVLPVHPWLVVFHLLKHVRLRVHVGQLEEYVYDENLADKLVLPADQKSLVKLLIDTQGGMFEDIVRGKGGGAVVLLTGAPGTGKTLTAEVYAESEQRALYSVQCSQLGVDPEHLEEELMRVFARARRWNAVMLLDEADVYVHERGNNMSQNAIVGVFLRVLEYQATILFLTSNRPQDVDDAIASRCIARLYYVAPDAADAKRIWRVLADTANLTVSEEVIAEFTARNPGITGRDIKNLLKLAGLMDGADQGITLEQIEYVQQFKPTGAVVVKEGTHDEQGA